jgi:hypothetical protein
MTLTQKLLIRAGMIQGTAIMKAANKAQRLRSIAFADISVSVP